MFTTQYKGYYIQGYFNSPNTRVVFPNGGEVIPGYKFRSYRAAQLFITKILGL